MLDEPLGALDAKLRQQTQLELVDIIHQVGVTCVMVTHDQEEAMTMATRIGIMSEGKILQIGAPNDVYENPNCRFVADFIGSVNLFAGKVMDSTPDHVDAAGGECRHHISRGYAQAQVGREVQLAVRPEKISIRHTPPQDGERASGSEVGCNAVQGRVEHLAYLGSLTTYHVKLASAMTVKVTVTNAARNGATPVHVGDQVHLWWHGSDVVVLTR